MGSVGSQTYINGIGFVPSLMGSEVFSTRRLSDRLMETGWPTDSDFRRGRIAAPPTSIRKAPGTMCIYTYMYAGEILERVRQHISFFV